MTLMKPSIPVTNIVLPIFSIVALVKSLSSMSTLKFLVSTSAFAFSDELSLLVGISIGAYFIPVAQASPQSLPIWL